MERVQDLDVVKPYYWFIAWDTILFIGSSGFRERVCCVCVPLCVCVCVCVSVIYLQPLFPVWCCSIGGCFFFMFMERKKRNTTRLINKSQLCCSVSFFFMLSICTLIFSTATGSTTITCLGMQFFHTPYELTSLILLFSLNPVMIMFSNDEIYWSIHLILTHLLSLFNADTSRCPMLAKADIDFQVYWLVLFFVHPVHMLSNYYVPTTLAYIQLLHVASN